MSKHEDNSADTPEGYQLVELQRAPIELYKILKFEGIVGSGGEAKAAIEAELVLVNGETETQKRKKIVAGDRIEFGGSKLFMQLAPGADAVAEPKPAAPKQPVTPKKPAKSPSRKPIGVRNSGKNNRPKTRG